MVEASSLDGVALICSSLSLYALAVGAGAVRRNKHTATATDDEVKKEVVRYLHGSADRGGGRTRHHKTTAVTELHHNVEVHFE